MARILYFGQTSIAATSRHRAEALKRIGHEVVLADPFLALSMCLKGVVLPRFHFHTGYTFLQRTITSWVINVLKISNGIDFVWIDSGELFGERALVAIRQLGVPVILFNHDDPTGQRDGGRFKSLKKSLYLYDLVTAVRKESEKELKDICSGKVLRIWRTYDEIQHSSNLISYPDLNLFLSDVCFIGTWMRHEQRDRFLLTLIENGIDVAIWGDRWQKSPLWRKLKQSWRGGALAGSQYVMAIRGSKICLGLLSKGNRDLHTTRTMEIPYAGGLLCAERTPEHLQLYEEDVEAVFWADETECVAKCKDLLENHEKRERIRIAGAKRVVVNKVGNEDICRLILNAVSK